MKTKNQIESVRIEIVSDADADSSNLGTYSDQRNNEFAIERENAGRNEYRWFNPNANNYASLPDAEIRKYCQQDYERAEALNDGQWHYVGVIAKAVVRSASGVSQTLRSGGLWGIESDSGKEYFAEIRAEQLSDLRTELLAFGFGPRAITHAFSTISKS